VIFIDLNRAENLSDGAPPAWEASLHDEIAQCELEVTIGGAPAPPAYIFMTNRGYLHRLQETSWSEFAIVDGFKIPDFPIGKACTTIFESHKARARHIEMYWLTQALVRGNPVPATFDARTPEEAYSTTPINRIRMGDKLTLEDNGEELTGFLVDAHVESNNQRVFGVLRTDHGDIFVTIPLSDVEMAIYRSAPDTFFDVVKPVSAPLTKPLEWFDFFARSYMKTKRETLLEWMKNFADFDSFKEKSQRELAEIYCDRMASSVWHQGQTPQTTTVERARGQTEELSD
jgi:hypothetical protein